MVMSILGLIISLGGTVLVALSIKEGEIILSGKREEHTAVFKQGMFRWGMALLAVGFLLQIWSVACKEGA